MTQTHTTSRERMADKPLFVPLRTKWFREFEAGKKTVEYRAYGPRWNRGTCYVGRKVTLSHGYSGARLSAEIYAIDVLSALLAPRVAQAIFPNAERIIAIWMDGITPAGRRAIAEGDGA